MSLLAQTQNEEIIIAITLDPVSTDFIPHLGWAEGTERWS